MISCIEWVPKGVADPTPKKYELSPAELELLEKQAEIEAALGEHGDGGHGELNADKPVGDSATTISNLPKIDPSTLPPELRMDEYSDDEDENDAVHGSMLGRMLVGNDSEMLGNRLDEEGMPVEDIPEDEKDEQDDEGGGEEDDEDDDDDDDDEEEDDLADVPDTREFMPVDIAGLEAMGIGHVGFNEEEDDDDDSDAEDVNLSPDDAIVIVAKTEDDFASLEVHVYEESTGNFFVHHDIVLPAFPLCLAHGDISPQGVAGNFVAVGSFSPGIEVWNLDVLNPLEPSCILGGEDTSAADELMKLNMMRAASGKRLKNQHFQRGGLRVGSHTDAVMALSWNKTHRQVIASGSADKTVKIWDITKAGESKANAATFTHHRDKVQAVVWHPSEGTLLATGSYDRSVAVLDARSSDTKKVKISADIEALAWDPHHSHYLTAATEDGVLSCWDVRNFSDPVWSFVVEEYGGVSDLSYNPNVPGFLATCAINKTVTLWDTYSKEGQPSLIPPQACGNKSMEVGKLFTLSFYQSSPWLLACGGSGNQLALWDMTREEAIQKRFGDRLSERRTVDEEETFARKDHDFEAMMAAGDAAIDEARENAAANKKDNNKKGKKKKGARKRGR